MNSRRSWLVFWVGIVAYIVAILQRTTLGVAGVEAADRFAVSAAALSSLAVVQLVVYAAAQIPVGVLIDRIGPRVLLLSGLVLMALGQIVLAIAPDIAIAVLGRILVGIGDAGIFPAVMRLVHSWFSGRSVPQLSQWVGNLGQVGQILSALPFAWLLHSAGWTPAFLTAGSLAVLATVVVIGVIADRPDDSLEQPRASSWGQSLDLLVSSLKRPGTRLGFWAHFVSQSSGTVFTLMWGFPFMVFGLGIDERLAASLLLVVVASGVVVGPILGVLSARFPYRRSNLVLLIVALVFSAWTLLLLWPGTPPLAVLVVLLVFLGIGGPGSLIGFDYARTYNPARSLGSANGVVNVGGFLASFVMMFLIGVVIDALGRGATSNAELYRLDSFRIAFLVQYVVVGVGVVFLLLTRRTVRTRLSDDEGINVGPIWVALLRRLRRSNG
ncbi:sugar phosphate permease [Labedella gwakjiensis]|uniref:MFS transporter n=1 Tax=Labedella gwakjiensis TaxID=390269 RepID=A0A2P8GZL9_9MICO|nr:MFS transporter [Labedella gwakjiensis]PSL39421.1 sugar phosphate permease [Labedella gwakjiensis]RUQ86173.1 MFS transporter [Labedella gwakjiensis]